MAWKALPWASFASVWANRVFCLWNSSCLWLRIIVCLQGVYAPSEIDGQIVVTYEDRIANLTQTLYRDMNTTLYSFRAPANESLITRLSPSDWSALNR